MEAESLHDVLPLIFHGIPSGEDVPDEVAVDVGEAEATALEFVAELGVVDS